MYYPIYWGLSIQWLWGSHLERLGCPYSLYIPYKWGSKELLGVSQPSNSHNDPRPGNPYKHTSQIEWQRDHQLRGFVNLWCLATALAIYNLEEQPKKRNGRGIWEKLGGCLSKFLGMPQNCLFDGENQDSGVPPFQTIPLVAFSAPCDQKTYLF